MGSITELQQPRARIPASDVHELCLACCGVAGIPLVDPRGILYVDVYMYHWSAQVTVLDKEYRSYIYPSDLD